MTYFFFLPGSCDGVQNWQEACSVLGEREFLSQKKIGRPCAAGLHRSNRGLYAVGLLRVVGGKAKVLQVNKIRHFMYNVI